MNRKTKKALTGASLALAAAGLVGCASSGDSNSASASSSANTTDLAHCYNVNVCKGHNDCQTANHTCAGQASCKGQGFVGMPTKSCADVGGEVRDSWRGKVNVADLAHCYNVNVCKGHNDCKTANNACAGHATCKGTGFVAMPEKACKDIGGEVGA